MNNICEYCGEKPQGENKVDQFGMCDECFDKRMDEKARGKIEKVYSKEEVEN